MTHETRPDRDAYPSIGSSPPTSEPIGSRPAPPLRMSEWVAALSLCPMVDQRYYEFTTQVFATIPVPRWDSFSHAGVHGQWLVPGTAFGSYVFRGEHRPWLQEGVRAFGGERAVLTAMVEAWVAALSTDLIPQMTAWARELERWDVLARVWAAHGENGVFQAATLQIFRDLPRAARESHPILTWASGVAISLLSETPEARLGVVWERLLLDSATLHSDWNARTETDVAVQAGTVRMIGGQRLPNTPASQPLDAAWRTKLAIDAFIDSRSRAGDSPSDTSHAVFRAFSARLALFRSDPLSAIAEAKWAMALSDWEPAATMAAEIEALAFSASHRDEDADQAKPSAKEIDDRLKGWELWGTGRIAAPS